MIAIYCALGVLYFAIGILFAAFIQAADARDTHPWGLGIMVAIWPLLLIIFAVLILLHCAGLLAARLGSWFYAKASKGKTK